MEREISVKLRSVSFLAKYLGFCSVHVGNTWRRCGRRVKDCRKTALWWYDSVVKSNGDKGTLLNYYNNQI